MLCYDLCVLAQSQFHPISSGHPVGYASVPSTCVMAWNLLHSQELCHEKGDFICFLYFKYYSLPKFHCLENCHLMYFVCLVWGYFKKEHKSVLVSS
jgi:hypothetical protein